MLRSKYILFTIFLLSVASVSAQKAERDYIRKGNRLFNDSVFVDAEVNYRKALEVNPSYTFNPSTILLIPLLISLSEDYNPYPIQYMPYPHSLQTTHIFSTQIPLI